MMVIWIFECNDETQWECFESNLFGSKARWPLDVKKGDLCFLYNYSRGTENMVYGIFRAISDGKPNIEPNAWGGRYQNQVRIQLASKERLGVPRFNISKYVTELKTARVKNKIFADHAQELLQYYAASYTKDKLLGEKLRFLEDDFRLRYPRNYRCIDGHDVRSLSEQTIDDWLSSHQVYHEYERLANVPEQLVPDFTVYTQERHPVFIEFWGLIGESEYDKRRLKKCEAYVRHRCKVIELYPEDLKNLDFNLRKKLQKQGVVVAK